MNEQNLNNIENENEPQELENEQVINETEAQDDFQFLGDPTQNTEKKEKPVSKLRHFMPLIVLGICAVLLISAVFVLQKFNKDDITEENPEDKKTIQLFDFTGTTATRLEIKNQLDSYAFVRKLEKTYYIENYQDCPVDNATVLSILTQFGSLEAVTEVAKDVTDFSQYQLDKPVSTVTWIKGDKKHTLEIGMVAASGNYYARVDGTNTVYTISSEVATLFVSPRMDFYNTHIYDFDKDTDANYINYFEIERKGEETIKIELSDLSQEDIDSAYVMVAPIKHNLSINKSNEFTDIVGNLSDCTVYSDDVSEKSLKEFGLTDPAITFTFVNVAEKHTFRISEPTDKGYSYMYHEGSKFVYIVDDSVLAILKHKTVDYLDSMAYSRSYDTIDSIVITGFNKRYEIDITGTSETEDLRAYINDKAVEFENYAELYSHIIGIEAKELTDNPSKSNLLVTITVNCKDGSVDTLKYYKQSDVESFFELNGEGRLLVSTSKVEQIIEFAQKLYDGEEIVTEW